MASQVVYVDTSALAALLVDQPEREALIRWLDATDADLVACDLLETELRRLAVREQIDQVLVTQILEGVSLATLDRSIMRSAGFLPMRYLRSLDAIHLEAALRLNADAILTYDARLQQAAQEVGLEVIAPK
ncbi:MAG: type II toxin-antitoxin system VapC family toxin [Actinomycetaceae bacterium]|nr:type II toxin-antitoxin system VapC family toxin [Actinomycetaceae bacterium]